MARVIRLTERDLVGLAAVRDLGADGIARLEQTLNDGPVLLNPVEFEKVVGTHVGLGAREAADVILRLVVSRRAMRKDVEALLDDVNETIRVRTGAEWLQEQRSAWEAARPQLLSLLQSERIEVLAKAIDLKYAHRSIYSRAQLITDVRPVFDAARRRPAAAVISHTLQITFNEDGEDKTVTLALDDADVEQLRAEAAAAREKAQSLLAFFEERLSDEMRFEIVGGDKADES